MKRKKTQSLSFRAGKRGEKIGKPCRVGFLGQLFDVVYAERVLERLGEVLSLFQSIEELVRPSRDHAVAETDYPPERLMAELITKHTDTDEVALLLESDDCGKGANIALFAAAVCKSVLIVKQDEPVVLLGGYRFCDDGGLAESFSRRPAQAYDVGLSLENDCSHHTDSADSSSMVTMMSVLVWAVSLPELKRPTLFLLV